jgi:hypothetical protein
MLLADIRIIDNSGYVYRKLKQSASYNYLDIFIQAWMNEIAYRLITNNDTVLGIRILIYICYRLWAKLLGERKKQSQLVVFKLKWSLTKFSWGSLKNEPNALRIQTFSLNTLGSNKENLYILPISFRKRGREEECREAGTKRPALTVSTAESSLVERRHLYRLKLRRPTRKPLRPIECN